jgi:hypothetical protein
MNYLHRLLIRFKSQFKPPLDIETGIMTFGKVITGIIGTFSKYLTEIIE